MTLYISIQTGIELLASWAISNADPANIVLLAVIYVRLSRSHSDMAERLNRLESRVERIQDNSTPTADHGGR